MKAKLQATTDYSMFVMHPLNRPIHRDKILEESMKNHGFMPSCAIHVVPDVKGRYVIIRGHHRFETAKSLGLPIYYIVDESDIDIFHIEGSQKQNWNSTDFAHARANAGDEDCKKLLWFMEKHSLPVGVACDLVGGHSAGSGLKSQLLRSGKFKVGDLSHANRVVSITDVCKQKGISFATNGSFVSAISLVLRIPEFSPSLFLHKVNLYYANIRKRSSTDEYLDEIEALYNYGNKKHPIPVAFRAKQLARERQRSFGKSKTNPLKGGGKQ